MNFLFKFYSKILGGHTHFRVFCGQSNGSSVQNWGSCGTFTMRNEEAKAFIQILKRGSGDGGEVKVEEE